MDFFLGDHEWEEAHLCSLHNKSGLNETLLLKVGNPYGGIPDMILLNLLMAASLVTTYLGMMAFAKYMQEKTGCRAFSARRRRSEGVKEEEKGRKTFGLLRWLLLDASWLEEVYGRNAMQFLMFERYLLLLLLIYLCMVCGAVLPVNVTRGELTDGSKFASTTLVNLKTSSGYLWLHVFLGWSFAPVSMLVMRRFATRVLVQFHYTSQGSAIVLEVRELPKKKKPHDFCCYF